LAIARVINLYTITRPKGIQQKKKHEKKGLRGSEIVREFKK